MSITGSLLCLWRTEHSQRLEGMMSKLKHELRILRDENQKLRNEVEAIRKDYAIYHSALVEIVKGTSNNYQLIHL